jgi:hypothetical protein
VERAKYDGALDSPVASTHIFRFRSWRRAARSLLADRHRLGDVAGLRFVRLVFVGGLRSEGFTFGLVDPRRQMAMCVWDDEAALERFMHASPVARSWLDATDEYCEVRLSPFRSHGSYRGEQPLASLPEAGAGEGPVAIWTFAAIPPRSLRFFWGEIRPAARRLLASPGLIAGTAGPERLYTGAMTFTIWQSLHEAVRFAYRRPPHRQIVKRVRDQAVLTDSMFIRFAPYAAEGRWPARSRFAARFELFRASLSDRAGVRGSASDGATRTRALPSRAA